MAALPGLGKENIYIIDTNVFVEYPDIISKIDKKYRIILSAKVIDELDYLKISLSEEQKMNVQKALRIINESFGKRDIKMDTADLSYCRMISIKNHLITLYFLLH